MILAAEMFRLGSLACCAARQSVVKRSYAVAAANPLGKKGGKKLGKMGGAVEKKILPVETDAKKLVKNVCGSNILKEGPDVELKPDSEYPDWLWTLNTGKAKTLSEMDPETKEYWFKVRKLNIIKHNKLAKLKKF